MKTLIKNTIKTITVSLAVATSLTTTLSATSIWGHETFLCEGRDIGRIEINHGNYLINKVGNKFDFESENVYLNTVSIGDGIDIKVRMVVQEYEEEELKNLRYVTLYMNEVKIISEICTSEF